MAYINTNTNQYPVSEADIRNAYPQTSFGTPFQAPAEYKWVFPVPPPVHSSLSQTVVEAFPNYSPKGFWEQDWEVVDLPQETVDANKARVQAAKWEAIKAERDRRTLNGVKVGANWFHSDTFSRTQQLGLVMMGSNMPTGIMWKTMTGSFLEMTPVLAQQIFQAVANSDSTLFAIAETKRVAMLALADPTNYDVFTGWPETFA